MLLKRTIYIFVLIGVFLYVFLFCFCDNIVNYYNYVNIVVFVMYSMLLMWSVEREENFYTFPRLGISVFVYSLFVVSLYLDLSFFYTNNSFFWDYTDPYVYFRMDEKLLNHEIPFVEMPAYIATTYGWGFDDWGANISQMLFLYLIPSRYFFFLMQIVLSSIGALFLFDICSKIMQKEHAYIAALSYSISSFTIYYLCSFRKENIMVFIILLCFWLFYRYLSSKKMSVLILAIVSTFPLLYFRPVIIALILVAFFSYFVSNNWGSSKMIPLLFVLIIVLVMAFSFIFETFNHYTAGGDLSKNENYQDTSTFGIIVSAIGAMIGPFPQVFLLDIKDISQLPLYGSGLLFKLFLFVFFWVGFARVIKKRFSEVLPLYVFCVLEMILLAVLNDGLELRKALPHVAIFYIASFWYISKLDSEMATAGSTHYFIPYIQTKNLHILIASFVFIASIFWNTR